MNNAAIPQPILMSDQDANQDLARLMKIVQDQALGINQMIDVLRDIDGRMRHLEALERKRGPAASKLIRVS